MCLEARSKGISVGDEEVIGYKILVSWVNREGLYSPTYAQRYEIGEYYHEDRFPSICNLCVYTYGYHMCESLESARAYLREIYEASEEHDIDRLDQCVIAKCRIPSGDVCVTGEDGTYHIPGLVCSGFVLDGIVETYDVDELDVL